MMASKASTQLHSPRVLTILTNNEFTTPRILRFDEAELNIE